MNAGKMREAALRVMIGRAVQQGFVPDEEGIDLPSGDMTIGGDMAPKLVDALVRLKHEKAAIQVDIQFDGMRGDDADAP